MQSTPPPPPPPPPLPAPIASSTSHLPSSLARRWGCRTARRPARVRRAGSSTARDRLAPRPWSRCRWRGAGSAVLRRAGVASRAGTTEFRHRQVPASRCGRSLACVKLEMEGLSLCDANDTAVWILVACLELFRMNRRILPWLYSLCFLAGACGSVTK